MHSCLRSGHTRRKTVWSLKSALGLSLLVLLAFVPAVAAAPSHRASKSDSEVSRRKNSNPNELTSVIVRLKPGAKLPAAFKQYAIDAYGAGTPSYPVTALELTPHDYRISFSH